MTHPADKPATADPIRGRASLGDFDLTVLTDGTYLLGTDPASPAVICLSYTWADDASKWLPLPVSERVEVVLQSLREIYPGVDVRRHVIGDPVSVSWEAEPHFMGAFKANLPGHYRYQHRLFTHFMQDSLPERHRGLFLAGDDVSWTAGWAWRQASISAW